MYAFIEWLVGGIVQIIVDTLSFNTKYILPKILFFLGLGIVGIFAFGAVLAITGI